MLARLIYCTSKRFFVHISNDCMIACLLAYYQLFTTLGVYAYREQSTIGNITIYSNEVLQSHQLYFPHLCIPFTSQLKFSNGYFNCH